jgi:SAM-dependent methyltransferase
LESDIVLSCAGCATLFPVRDGIPLLLPEVRSVEKRPFDHQLNSLPPEVIALLESTTGYSLNLGGGSTPKRFERCLELDDAIFRNTTVIGDITCLPLATGAFDLVVSLNMLEHVDDPARAACEMIRVLRPGGLVFVHTAFLQPLHADRHHFYNATEGGVRRWFSGTEIQSCTISPNFHPGLALSWIAADLLDLLRGELNDSVVKEIEAMPLGRLAWYWKEPASRSDACWEAFGRLSQAAQARVAAGFQLVARKPEG